MALFGPALSGIDAILFFFRKVSGTLAMRYYRPGRG
jgi:hypothetical protein